MPDEVMKTSKPKSVIKLPKQDVFALLVNHYIDPTSNVESQHVAEGIKKAVRSYLRTVIFHRDHKDDSLIQLANAAGDPELGTALFIAELQGTDVPDWPKELPKPPHFPATLKDFFDLVVRAKTPADSMKRFRDFLKSYHQYYKHPLWLRKKQCSDSKAETKTMTMLHAINAADREAGYFSPVRWVRLAAAYSTWWRDQKSRKASDAAKKRKRGS